MIYNNILETIGNTPVVRLNRMEPKNVEVYVKVESFNPMASVKDRLAYAIVTDAELSTYYDANPNSFSTPEQVHARNILIKVEEGASVEDKAAARSENLAALQHVLADLVRRAPVNHGSGITAAAPEHYVFAKLLLQGLAVHTAGTDLNRG